MNEKITWMAGKARKRLPDSSYVAKMYDFVRKNDIEKDVVFFATDSICTKKKLDVNSSLEWNWAIKF